MRDGDRERAREGERERKNLDKYIILLWIERERENGHSKSYVLGLLSYAYIHPETASCR